MRLKSTLTALALSLAALSALAAPVLAKEQDKPEPARVYKDWVVGCRYICEAVVVLPEGDAEGYTLTMSMEAWEYSSFDLDLVLHDPIGDTLQKANGPYRLLIDGKALATFQWDDKAESWDGSLNRNHSVTLAKGKLGEIVDKNSRRVSYISLSGATAAMRDMDQRMGIVGYTHALVARGKKQVKKGQDTLPTPNTVAGNYVPKQQVLSNPPSPSAVMDWAIKYSGCADDRDEVDARFDAIHPLMRFEDSRDAALILVGCGHGAYNYNVMPMLATKVQPNKWVVTKFEVRGFDFKSDFPMPILTNATWDAKEEKLAHYNKGRGIGDCGESAIYEISPYGPAYVYEIREMPVCRGATHWPRIW